jgi:hypothetical protein
MTASTYVCVVRKLVWILRSRQTIPTASETSDTVVATSQMLRAMLSGASALYQDNVRR